MKKSWKLLKISLKVHLREVWHLWLQEGGCRGGCEGGDRQGGGFDSQVPAGVRWFSGRASRTWSRIICRGNLRGRWEGRSHWGWGSWWDQRLQAWWAALKYLFKIHLISLIHYNFFQKINCRPHLVRPPADGFQELLSLGWWGGTGGPVESLVTRLPCDWTCNKASSNIPPSITSLNFPPSITS